MAAVSGPVASLGGMGFKLVTGQPLAIGDGLGAVANMLPLPNVMPVQVGFGILVDQAINAFADLIR